jgi:hypothetical protein
MIARSARRLRLDQSRGQSLVEFALILPLLLVILLGIADLGRVFQSAITTEAAVRDSAEAAAQEYLQIDRTTPAPGLDSAGYGALHTRALDVACREAERLPERVTSGSACVMPVIAVCVHDDTAGDPGCGAEASGAPAECTEMAGAWNPARAVPSAGPGLPYVEVRMCYRFDPLITVPLGDWGTIWLQKSNIFTIATY